MEVYPSKEFKRKWNRRKTFSCLENLEKKTYLVRHRERHRDIDGAVYWSSLLLVPWRDFEREGARTFSDSQWLCDTQRGSNKPRFPFCVDSNNSLLYVRAIQGHSGGDLIDHDLLNHVATPPRWKEYLCSVGSSFTVNSTLQARVIAGGKDTKRRATDGLLHTSRPRRWWNWRRIRCLWKTQDKGLQFWQTRSHAIILYDSVPADCCEKVVSTREDKICTKGFLRHDLMRKMVLKNAWKVQHDTEVTMTMTLREVQPPSMEAWPYKQECRGHDPTKKNLLRWCGLLCWQVVHLNTVRDSV